jgi:predicted DCC family thiol-disulfide oxidoreductase YuxK
VEVEGHLDDVAVIGCGRAAPHPASVAGRAGRANPAATWQSERMATASPTEAARAGAAIDAAADPVMLYDGTCGLCHRSVRFFLRHERDAEMRFAPLQGPTAATLRAEHPEIPKTLESVVLVQGGRVFLRSKAFLHAARHLRAPWRWGHAFRWMPGFLLDLGYRFIAAIRYRVWGRAEMCDVPSPEHRARFLD